MAGFQYFAFISYNARDLIWGKRIQRKLEHYRMPAELCSARGWKRKPINPVFFAPTDIQPGPLSEELQKRLRAARHLIVICSPHAAQSDWVGKEIEFFHRLGRTDQIHFFIVEGTPHSGDPETECLNPVIERLGIPEILGANIHEKVFHLSWMNRERAYVQLISKLLNVEFDTIWKRHRRRLIQQVFLVCCSFLILAFAAVALWAQNLPVDLEVHLQEMTPVNPNLPVMDKATVILQLENEEKCDTIHSWEDNASFVNIPHKYLGRVGRIQVESRDFQKLDTTVALSRQIVLPLRRDPSVYGHITIQLWNSEKWTSVAGKTICIAAQRFHSDENGRIYASIPLEEQAPSYEVTDTLGQSLGMIVMPLSENSIFEIL